MRCLANVTNAFRLQFGGSTVALFRQDPMTDQAHDGEPRVKSYRTRQEPRGGDSIFLPLLSILFLECLINDTHRSTIVNV